MINNGERRPGQAPGTGEKKVTPTNKLDSTADTDSSAIYEPCPVKGCAGRVRPGSTCPMHPTEIPNRSFDVMMRRRPKDTVRGGGRQLLRDGRWVNARPVGGGR